MYDELNFVSLSIMILVKIYSVSVPNAIRAKQYQNRHRVCCKKLLKIFMMPFMCDAPPGLSTSTLSVQRALLLLVCVNVYDCQAVIKLDVFAIAHNS
jgi:hypothetical protein